MGRATGPRLNLVSPLTKTKSTNEIILISFNGNIDPNHFPIQLGTDETFEVLPLPERPVTKIG